MPPTRRSDAVGERLSIQPIYRSASLASALPRCVSSCWRLKRGEGRGITTSPESSMSALQTGQSAMRSIDTFQGHPEVWCAGIEDSPGQHWNFMLVLLQPGAVGGDIPDLQCGPGQRVLEERRNF